MVRPRFAKLPPAQQQAILRAALDEFATHGFHNASLNRVIAAAGISKGLMYCYFDDKEDLFTHLTRVELERLLTDIGPLRLPADPGPDAFWEAVQRFYRDSVAQLATNPQLNSLRRAWLGDPALKRAQQTLEPEVTPWLERLLATGQSCGAVRTDLPAGLLIAVAVSMATAMDTWLMAQPAQTMASPPIGAMVGMLCRALEPPEV